MSTLTKKQLEALEKKRKEKKAERKFFVVKDGDGNVLRETEWKGGQPKKRKRKKK